MKSIILFDEPEPHRLSFIEWAVRRGLPYLPADEANAEIVRLNVENLKLQAALDAIRVTLWDERGKP